MEEQNNFDIRNVTYANYVSKHFGIFHKLERIEQEYEKMYFWWKEHLYGIIKHLDRKKIKILEIGCGLGHHLYALKRLEFKNVLGIDISPECVEFCRKKGFNVLQADAFDFLPQHIGEYDIIIAFDLIEHLTKEESYFLLKYMLNSLKDDGFIIINAPNANNPLTLRERYIDITHQVIYTPESIRQLILTSGFKRVKIFGVKPFSTLDKSFWRAYLKKFIMLPIYKLSLGLLRLFYYMQGYQDVRILENKLIAIGYK